jgi:FAD dependent oxidoreductase
LPIDPAQVAPDPGAIERLEAMCASLSPALSSRKIRARQACYRPITGDGLPLIGRVPGVAGAYVATGHSVWGILNAPATGEAIAELIVDGSPHKVDLRPFDPGRLPPVEPDIQGWIGAIRGGAEVARIFITGSSDGLGLMAARLLVDQGHEVVLHGRNEGRSREALAAAAGARGVVSGDLSNSAS